MNQKALQIRNKGSRVRLHEERMRRIQQRHIPIPEDFNRRYNQSGEAEVVLGAELSLVLREWIVKYLADRPEHSYAIGEDSWHGNVEFIGPMQLLAEHTEINIRRVSGICNGEFKHVPLTQAEALLKPIDRLFKLSNGEITIIPNPNWSPEHWVAYMQERGCC